jgi:hypothetical protein
MSETAGCDPALTAAFRRTGLTSREMWLQYVALGGNAGELMVDAQLCGLVDLPRGEYNVLAHAINEGLDELPEAERGTKVAYRRPLSNLNADRGW